MASLLDILGAVARAEGDVKDKSEAQRKQEAAQEQQKKQNLISLLNAGYVNAPDESRTQGALNAVAPPQLDKAPMQQAMLGRQQTSAQAPAPLSMPLSPSSTQGQTGLQAGAQSILPMMMALQGGGIGKTPAPPVRPEMKQMQAPTGSAAPRLPQARTGGLRPLSKGVIDTGQGTSGGVGRYIKSNPLTTKESASLKLNEGDQALKKMQIEAAIRDGDLDRAIAWAEAKTKQDIVDLQKVKTENKDKIADVERNLGKALAKLEATVTDRESAIKVVKNLTKAIDDNELSPSEKKPLYKALQKTVALLDKNFADEGGMYSEDKKYNPGTELGGKFSGSIGLFNKTGLSTKLPGTKITTTEGI